MEGSTASSHLIPSHPLLLNIFTGGGKIVYQLQEEITGHSKMQVQSALSLQPAGISSPLTENSEAIYSWIIN